MNETVRRPPSMEPCPSGGSCTLGQAHLGPCLDRALRWCGPIVAVYGTLRRGCVNHRSIEDAGPEGEAWTDTGYALFDLGAYPAVVPDGGIRRVWCELYRTSPVILERLDRLEGVPHHYTRERVRTRRSGGRLGPVAYIYLMTAAQVNRRGGTIIPSGDWIARDRRTA